MQRIFEKWLPRYYPRFNKEQFAALLQDARRWQIPTQDFQYIVLGCGYLYHVRPIDPEEVVQKVTQQLTAQHGSIAAAALMDDKQTRRMRAMAKEQALLVGPGNRQLGEKRKPGPIPHPAPRIASLAIARWVVKNKPQLAPAHWACRLYTALSCKSMGEETFARYKEVAEKAQVSVWIGKEEMRIPAIDHLLDFLDNRYRRFQHDGFPIPEALKNPGILYPIDFLSPVLRAVDFDFKDNEQPMVSFFSSGKD